MVGRVSQNGDKSVFRPRRVCKVRQPFWAHYWGNYRPSLRCPTRSWDRVEDRMNAARVCPTPQAAPPPSVAVGLNQTGITRPWLLPGVRWRRVMSVWFTWICNTAESGSPERVRYQGHRRPAVVGKKKPSDGAQHDQTAFVFDADKLPLRPLRDGAPGKCPRCLGQELAPVKSGTRLRGRRGGPPDGRG